jgi:hypothetical protein
MSLQNLMIELPGINEFIADIIEDCYDRKSVIVVVPPQLNISEIEYLIREKVFQQTIHVEEFILSELPMGALPIDQIAGRFLSDWVLENLPMTIERLLTLPGLPECIFLYGFNMLEKKDKDLWLDFLNNWNKTPFSGGKWHIQQKPALCLILSGTDFLTCTLDSVPQLSIRYWFGFPSVLELRLLCRFNRNYLSAQDEKARWREYLIPSLAETDVALADKLWERVLEPVEDLINFLSIDAQNKGWNKELLSKWGIYDFLKNNEKNMSIGKICNSYLLLLANGVICRTPEYGTELHISALAALEEYDRIKTRIWRGQLHLILPMVDNIRLFICDKLTNRQGEGWPLYFPPKEVEEFDRARENPRACQLGHLYYTIKNSSKFIEEKKYLDLINITKKIRNELTHYRPINYSDYQNMVYEAQKFQIDI